VAAGTHAGGCAYTTYQNNLYVGLLAGGLGDDDEIAYLQSQSPVFSDHGVLVASHFYSPTFDMGVRNINKWFRKFVVNGEAGGSSGILTVGYSIDENIPAGNKFDKLDIDQEDGGISPVSSAGGLSFPVTRVEFGKHINFDFGTFGKTIRFFVAQLGNAEMGVTGISVYYDLMPDIDTDDTQSTTQFYDK
jgi:hypothetical protein